MKRDESTSSTRTPNYSALKERINTGELTLVHFEGKSKIWEIFAKIENIPNLVSFKICKNLYKYSKTSTSNFVKPKCYNFKKIRTDVKDAPVEVDAGDKRRSALLFTKWTLQNCRPLKIVEDAGPEDIIKFCISIDAKYGESVHLKSLLTHRTTLSRNINTLHNAYFSEVKVEVNAIKGSGFALKSDLWTDNFIRGTYIAVTIRYILNGSMVCRLLGFKPMDERCTGVNIESKVYNVLDEFNCRPYELDIVRDRGSNMISAFKNHNRLNCFAHLLHNCIKKAMDSNLEIVQLCNACSNLVKFFKSNGLNSCLKTTLKSFSKTRWNSIYYLFESVERNWADIIQILQEKGEFTLVTNINVAHISTVLKILHPLEETFKKLEGEKHPTIHLVYLYINRLKQKIASDENNFDIIKKFKDSLLSQLETTVINNLSIYHRIALSLFPPATKLVQFTESEKYETKEKCKSRMTSSFDENVSSDNQEQTGSLLSAINQELLSDYMTPVEAVTPHDNVLKELTEYQSENVIFFDKFDVLQWWNTNKKRFPLLYKLSC